MVYKYIKYFFIEEKEVLEPQISPLGQDDKIKSLAFHTGIQYSCICYHNIFNPLVPDRKCASFR